jgi:hypothetical protein
MVSIAVPSGTHGVRAVAILLALLLIVLTARTTLCSVLVGPAPTLAYQIDSGNSSALAETSERLLAGARTIEEFEAVKTVATASLSRSPLEVTALRNLGFAAAATSGDAANADPFLDLARRTSLRDVPTHAWLLTRYKALGRAADAIAEADILLRQRAELWPTILPELVLLLTGNEEAVRPLAATLASKPYWRGSFLLMAGTNAPNKDILFALFERMTAIGSPPTSDEIAGYFTGPDKWSDPRKMLARWRSLVPEARSAPLSLIRDGEFNGVDGPPPFNWTFFDSDGGYSRIAPGPSDGRGHALELSIDGSREVVLAQQMLVLRPGRYRLRAKLFAEEKSEHAQFGWKLECIGGAPLGQTRLDADERAWRTAELAFAIPNNCPGQRISIMGYPTLGLDPASAWLDGLSLSPLPS